MEYVLIGLFGALLTGAGAGASKLWRARQARHHQDEDETLVAQLRALGQVRAGEVVVISREADRRVLVWCASVALRKLRLELPGVARTSGTLGLDPVLSKGRLRLDQASLQGSAQALLELLDPTLDADACAVLYLHAAPVREITITDTQAVVQLGLERVGAQGVDEALRLVGMVLDRARGLLARLEAREATPVLLGHAVRHTPEHGAHALKQQAIEALALWWPEHAYTQEALSLVRARRDEQEWLALLRAAPEQLLDALDEEALVHALELGLSQDLLTPAQLWEMVDRRITLEKLLRARPSRALRDAVISAAAARGLPEGAWRAIRPRLARSKAHARLRWIEALDDVDVARCEDAVLRDLLGHLMQPPDDADDVVARMHAWATARLIVRAADRLDATTLEPLLLRWLSSASPNAALALLPAVEAIGGAQSVARLERITSHPDTPGALLRGCLRTRDALIRRAQARPERGGLSLSAPTEAQGALSLTRAVEGGDLTILSDEGAR